MESSAGRSPTAAIWSEAHRNAPEPSALLLLLYEQPLDSTTVSCLVGAFSIRSGSLVCPSSWRQIQVKRSLGPIWSTLAGMFWSLLRPEPSRDPVSKVINHRHSHQIKTLSFLKLELKLRNEEKSFEFLSAAIWRLFTCGVASMTSTGMPTDNRIPVRSAAGSSPNYRLIACFLLYPADLPQTYCS
jgi:hypothetical protein